MARELLASVLLAVIGLGLYIVASAFLIQSQKTGNPKAVRWLGVGGLGLLLLLGSGMLLEKLPLGLTSISTLGILLMVNYRGANRKD